MLPVDVLGLTIDPTELDEDDVVVLLRRLVKAHEGVAWAIGDLLAVKMPYGSKQRFAVEELGLTEAQAMHWPWVARRIPRRNRRRELSWTAHRAVAPLPATEQAEWLEKAVVGGWSVSRLEEEIRAEHLPVAAPAAEPVAELDPDPQVPAALPPLPAMARAARCRPQRAVPSEDLEQLTLPLSLVERIRAEARTRGVPIVRLVADAVESYLAPS